MKSAVETLSPTRAKLTVEVPFEELKPSLDKAYQTIAQQINVPGFRRGKVPPMVIDRQVGRGAVLEQAINEVVPQKYVEALQSHDLQPLAQPDIEVTKMDDNETLEFTAEVDVRPEITVPDYSGLTAEVDDTEVTDDDVDEQIQALRERFGSLADVERPAADGDFVVIDLVATKDGEPVEGAEVSGMSYRVGRGGMLEGLDEALAGMSAGDDTTFTSQLVGGDLVGEDVEVQVKVSQVQAQELPELDDEFAQLASEFDTADELTDDVRNRLGNGKRLEQAAAARDAVLEKLLELVEVPLPEGVVTDELNQRRESIEQQLAYAGLTLDKYLEDEGQTQEEFEADLERRVRDSVAAQFVLDEVAKLPGARRRPERADPAHGDACPAVGPGPAGVRQPHVRAQPRARAGRGDPPGQGAGPDRRGRDRHRRVRPRRRPEEPPSRRHPGRSRRGDRRGRRRGRRGDRRRRGRHDRRLTLGR